MKDISSDIMTATDMKEMRPGLYISVIDGRYFRLSHIQDDDTLVLSMGATNVSELTRKELSQNLKGIKISKEYGPFFFNHHVSLVFSVRFDWMTPLKSSIQVLLDWAKNHDVHGGCYLCGVDDESVEFRQEPHEKIFACEKCKVALQDETILPRKTLDTLVAENSLFKRKLKGTLYTVIHRFILSVIWIPVYALFLTMTSAERVGMQINAQAMKIAIVPLIFYFLALFTSYFVFERKAHAMSSSLLSFTILNSLSMVAEIILVLSLVKSSLTGESALNIAKNISLHMDQPPLSNLGFFVFVYPFFGLAIAYVFLFFIRLRKYRK